MTISELRPGELLMLVLPNKEFHGSLELTVSYEEVLEALKVKKARGKSRRSATAGRLLSRQIGLGMAAIAKGKWSTGAAIDRGSVLRKVLTSFEALSAPELADVTPKARASFEKAFHNASSGHFNGQDMQRWMNAVHQLNSVLP